MTDSQDGEETEGLNIIWASEPRPILWIHRGADGEVGVELRTPGRDAGEESRDARLWTGWRGAAETAGE